MLKITYSDGATQLDHLADPLETVIARRMVLAVRTGQPIHLQPIQASFLLDIPPRHYQVLAHAIQGERSRWSTDPTLGPNLTVETLEGTVIEVSLPGLWLSRDRHAHTGIVVTRLSDRLETLLANLWQHHTLLSSC
jgi:hypothetical protein